MTEPTIVYCSKCGGRHYSDAQHMCNLSRAELLERVTQLHYLVMDLQKENKELKEQLAGATS